jgi:hypothetical protein
VLVNLSRDDEVEGPVIAPLFPTVSLQIFIELFCLFLFDNILIIMFNQNSSLSLSFNTET